MIDCRVLLNTGKILTMILFNLACNNIVCAVYRWTTQYMVSKPQTPRWLHCFECSQLSWWPSWIYDHDCRNKHIVWSNNCVTSLVSCDGKQITTHVDQIRAQRRLFEWLLMFLQPFWFFASVQNCSSFCDWHSTDLDSAGRNHIETTKKLYICRKTWLSAISPGL